MQDTLDAPITGELLAAASEGNSARDIIANGGTMQQVKTGYTTAVAVQRPRDLQTVHKRLLAESRMAGESFYYGWGSGKDRIEGPSIGLAMAAARCFGNSAVDMLPLQDAGDSWILTAVFVDLETGYTLTRQFRQSKKSVVHGKHDAERKDDIRFQIGQSKAARNVVTNALPQWLIDAAVKEAKDGVRQRIEEFIAKKGLPAAVDLCLNGLAKHGVLEKHVLEKCEVAKREGLTLDHIVMLRGDLHALDNGTDYASALFASMDDTTGAKVGRSSVNDKLDEPKRETASNGNAPTDAELEAAGINEKPAKKTKGEMFDKSPPANEA